MAKAETKIVLVVEERLESRHELVDFLRTLDFITIPVADPDSATVIVRKVRLDLVLWDVSRLDVTTMAAVSEFKKRRPEMAVVLLADSDSLEILSRSAGADEVLRKPVTLEGLEERIRGLLRRAAS